jgi:type I restriction enzyme S subunit
MTFEEKTLGEVSKFSNNLRKPVTKSQRQGGQFPYYGAAGIQDFVSDFLFDGKYILVGEDGTVVTDDSHPVVQIADGRFWVNNHAHVIQPLDMDDFDYLYYSLVNSKVDDLVTGAVQPKLSMTNLKSLRLKWAVSPSVRKSVGSVLGLLDAKIAINREVSKSLEQIAQTIFKSWFIDFDPVKSKIAGEKPVGVDDATAALFPDSMEDSEVGPIPNGWTLSHIGDEVACVGGSTPSTSNSDFWDGEIFWTTPKDLSKQIGLVTTSSERRITSKGLQKISSGVLPVHSVLMSCRAPIGYLSINAVPTAVNQGFIALRHSPKYSPLYLLFWLRANMYEIKNRAGGATFAEISRAAFKEIPFIVPDYGILRRFAEVAEPILQKMVSLTLQNQELVSLRDSLLPRLISGELQIPEEVLVS